MTLVGSIPLGYFLGGLIKSVRFKYYTIILVFILPVLFWFLKIENSADLIKNYGIFGFVYAGLVPTFLMLIGTLVGVGLTLSILSNKNLS